MAARETSRGGTRAVGRKNNRAAVAAAICTRIVTVAHHETPRVVSGFEENVEQGETSTKNGAPRVLLHRGTGGRFCATVGATGGVLKT